MSLEPIAGAKVHQPRYLRELQKKLSKPAALQARAKVPIDFVTRGLESPRVAVSKYRKRRQQRPATNLRKSFESSVPQAAQHLFEWHGWPSAHGPGRRIRSQNASKSLPCSS